MGIRPAVERGIRIGWERFAHIQYIQPGGVQFGIKRPQIHHGIQAFQGVERFRRRLGRHRQQDQADIQRLQFIVAIDFGSDEL